MEREIEQSIWTRLKTELKMRGNDILKIAVKTEEWRDEEN